jgi:hypothetical protein
MFLFELLHFEKDFAFAGGERTELAVAIVNNADGGSKAKFHGALANNERVFRRADAAA